MTQAYPLQWPTGKPRTPRPQRSRFDTQMSYARDRLMNELNLLGARDVVLSTNMPARRDGLPYANARQPDDSGVAVYFTYKGNQMSFACDRWDQVKDNVQAIRKTIEALRGIARWGTGDMMEAAFTGFQALPPPMTPVNRHWTEVLGVSADSSIEEIKSAYANKAKKAHPDAGGSSEEMAELNAAIREARKGKS